MGGLLCVALAIATYVGTSSRLADNNASEAPIPATGITALAASLECLDDQDPFVCVDSAIERIYDTDGAAVLVSTLDRWRDEAYPDPLPCHRVFHLLGKKSVGELSLDEVLTDIALTEGVCDDGYVHGAIEGLGYGADYQTLPSSLNSLCESLPERMVADCLHSSGHALAINQHLDVRAALDGCGVFGEEARRCAAGVFMTFGRGLPGYETSDSTQWITYRDEDLPILCREVRDDYADPCWFQIWTAYGFAPERGGPDDLAKICPASGERGFEYCYRGVGMLLLGRDGRDAAVAASMCPTDTERRRWCAYGIAWGSGYDYHLAFDSYEGYDSPCPRFPEELQEVCRTAEQDATLEGDGL